MTKEKEDVKVEVEAQADPSPAEQQTPNDSEIVKTQDVAENVKRALQAERERRKEAEARSKELEQQLEAKQANNTSDVDDDAYQRFVRLEAETKINSKMFNDPSFKERADLVRDTMEKTGLDVETADAMVKANLYDQLLKETPSEPKEVIANNLKSKPISEPTLPKKTGNMLDDIASGAVVVDPHLRAAIMKYRK